VEYVLKHHHSFGKTSKEYGIEKKSVREWVAKYRYHGVSGLQTKHSRYDGQYKIDVIEYMLKNCLSIFKTAVIFGITRSSIRSWLRIYSEKGILALFRKSRSEKNMFNNDNTNITKESDKDLMIKDLQLKNYHLQMENDYLKKLNDIIQEDVKVVKKKTK
jgi:transposase